MSQYWYHTSLRFPLIFLLPFSWMFRFGVVTRRFFYRCRILKTHRFKKPVIVVGNITVGGTGKTPLVIWLANFLKAQGFKPGIVSRGVGGIKHKKPYWVKKDSDPTITGDEALLLLKRTEVPVVIGINRAAAVKEILSKTDVDVVISDDGLQHYRMGRDIEIAVVDGMRQFGNKRFLPAGPLRESPKRLNTVDWVVTQGAASKTALTLNLSGNTLVGVRSPSLKKEITQIPDTRVHAIAGIGNPSRFFNTLREMGLQVIEHAFPDHYLYRKQDIYFADNLWVLMTEKDAVKCKHFADSRHWCLPVDATVDGKLGDALLRRLHEIQLRA